jgi:hypothetical protein
MYGEMEMIRLRTEYETDGWYLNGKVAFASKRKSWNKSQYFLTPPYPTQNIHKFLGNYLGGKPHTIGATCLTVWSK